VRVPRATPTPIIARLNHTINAGLADRVIKARLAAVATTPMVFTPDEFGGYLASEMDKWRAVVRAANIHLDRGAGRPRRNRAFQARPNGL
jgi:tripartite-type tricarboxylate transporter receptor subunit TctC